MTSVNATGSTDTSVQSTSTTSSDQSLTSDDFMELLLVQLQYQDPTAPMDSSEIVSQMADLTTVTAMTELQGSVEDLSVQLYSSQALYASTLVGQDVMVLANVMTIKDGDTVAGQILLPTPADDLNINIYDSSDNLVATLPLGEQTESGEIDFDLADLEEELPAGEYRLEAMATIDGNDMEVAITQSTTVTGVVIPGPGQEVLVEVENIGLVPLSYITKLEGSSVPEGGEETEGDFGIQSEGSQMAPNHYFNRDLLKKFPGLEQSGLVDTSTRQPDTLSAIPLGPASLAVARNS